LWYYIYQLSDPSNISIIDRFGNNILDTAAWSLSRHPIEMVSYQSFVIGSRSDVFYEGKLSVNP